MINCVVIRSLPNPSEGKRWLVEKNGEIISSHRVQRSAQVAAVRISNEILRQGGRAVTQFHRRDGRIKGERVYGARSTLGRGT